MFSIQQLVKTTRRLQVNNVNVTSVELAKSLKYAAVTGTSDKQPQPQPHIEASGSGSLLAAHDMATTTAALSSSPKQQKQINASIENPHTSVLPTNSQQSVNNIGKLSLCSHLNENGSSSTKTATVATAQNQKLNSTTTTTRTTLQQLCHNRSQQIQNFYQQQLHQFHTHHNQSLWAKQKQIHFTMSSLAAAEPLSSPKSSDGLGAIASNGNYSGKLNGDNTADNSSSSAAATNSGKTCFKSGLGEILQFMELIGNLKHTKRTGWVLRDVNDCESISGHMYRMSMMTFLLDGTEGLNQIRCMELALVHDLAESIVGDLTPFCGISKEEKRAMEFKAMDDICKLIEPRGKHIMELFEEYETGESEESKFVKDLDRLDMVMQAFEYEKRDNCLLKHQEFFNSTEGKFKHPFVKQLVNEIYEQRTSLAKERGATPPPNVIVVPEWEKSATPPSNGHNAKADSAEEQVVGKSTSSSSSS